VDAAGDGERRQQQHDEGNVVEQHQVQDFVERRRDAEHHGERHNDQQRPCGGDLAEVVMPEGCGRQRHDGDGEQDAHERQRPGGVSEEVIADVVRGAWSPSPRADRVLH